eukprot:841545-Pyramimonas_sp.AAC.1
MYTGLQFIESEYLIGCPNHSTKKKRRRTAEDEVLQHAPWLPKAMKPLVKRLENDLCDLDDVARGPKRQAAIAAKGRIRSVMAAAARITEGEGLAPNDDETRWQAREKKRMQRLRAHLAPVILGEHTRLGGGGVNATENPAALRGFQNVAGHDEHVRALKEMVLLPLVYPDVFEALQ